MVATRRSDRIATYGSNAAMNRITQIAIQTAACLTAAFAALAPSPAAAQTNSTMIAVTPQRLDGYWVMTNTSLDVDMPSRGKNLYVPACAAVTYMIGSDGRTRDVKVRRVIPEGDLDIVAKSAVKDMRYVSGPENKAMAPVFTYIIIPFNLPKDPATRKKVTDACTLPDFPQAYQ